MAHKVQNFEIHAGDDLVIPVTVKDDADVVVDLSGASVKWEASRGNTEKFSKTASVTKSSPASGIVITDAANGVFEVTLDSADSQTLRGEFYHEAEVTDSSGNKTTVMTGVLTIAPTLIV